MAQRSQLHLTIGLIAATLTALVLATGPAWAQDAPKTEDPAGAAAPNEAAADTEADVAAEGEAKEKNEGAWGVLLVPLTVLVGMSLQIATTCVFPRFSRRCANAVRTMWWQTPLLGGFALLLAVFVSAIAGQVGPQVAAIPLLVTWVLTTVGGVGVALVAGRWGIARVDAETQAHPIVEVIAGDCLLGWGMVLIPCVGLIGWLYVVAASAGALLMVLIRGSKLDEVRRRTAPAPFAAGPAPASPAPTPAPQPQPTPESGPPAGGSDDAGQVF